MSEASLRSLPAPRGLHGPSEAFVLRALSWLSLGALELELPDGETRRFGDPAAAPVRAQVLSRDFFRRVARNWRLGIGESYAAGDWRCDDLPGLFELLIRNAEELRRRHPALARLGRLRPRLPAPQTKGRARRNIRYHYDLGNELYRLFLDESLTYSCAVWDDPAHTLAEAQRTKLRRVCDKLRLSPDDHVLEIGCGWGSLALVAAGEYGARVTGVTISSRQYELARERVRAAGLEHRVEILEQDYRTLDGEYTRIASVEMLEAIGYEQYDTFFRTCERLLARDGVACIQTIAIPDQRFERYRRSEDWIQRYVFPGSLLPSLEALTRSMTRSSELIVHAVEEIGPHYARTLREWRERFLAALPEVRALGYDERFVRIWEFYLAYCEAAFSTRALRDVQLVLTRSFNERL